MRFPRWIVMSLLAASSVLAIGHLAAADDAQVARGIADQLNSQWAPNAPAFTPESVASQRGPDKFGGWGGVRIGGIISVTVAKSTLAAPNNTLTSEEALALATQQVMDARQGKGWGRVAQDLTGQKLGALMKDTQPAAAAATSPSRSTGKSPKEPGQSPGKAIGKTDQTASKTFDAPAPHSTGVVVSGPGVGGGSGRGSGKDASGKDVAGKDTAGGPGGGGGHGGGHGSGNGGQWQRWRQWQWWRQRQWRRRRQWWRRRQGQIAPADAARSCRFLRRRRGHSPTPAWLSPGFSRPPFPGFSRTP